MQNKTLQMKRALRTALLVLLLSTTEMIKGYAQNFDFSSVCSTGQTLYYKITDATNHYVKLTCPGQADYNTCWNGFEKPAGDIVLPNIVHYNGTAFTISSIGDYAFYQCEGLTGSLNIPNTITTIGKCSFEGCNGFTGSLTIPVTLVSIGRGAFGMCSNFSEIHYNATNCIDTTPAGMFHPFRSCSGVLVLGENVEKIPNNIFISAAFTGELNIPNSCVEIGAGAFGHCVGFTGDLTIPNSVTTIGDGAFSNCIGFNGSLLIPSSVTSLGQRVFSQCSGFSEVYYNATHCADGTNNHFPPFMDCGDLGVLYIGENVERIPKYMFYTASFSEVHYDAINCADATDLNYPNFNNCHGKLVIGNNVERIPKNMFHNAYFSEVHYNAINCADATDPYFPGCHGELVIGNNVEIIPKEMFRYSHFSSIIIPNSIIEIREDAFDVSNTNSDVYYLGDVYHWCNILFKNRNANPLAKAHKLYINDDLVSDLIIPETINSIKQYAFAGAGCFNSITLPNSLVSIQKNAFDGCSGMTAVYYSGSLEQWCRISFENYTSHPLCSSVHFSRNLYINGELVIDLIIPESITEIKNYAFYGCNCFTKLIIPQSVTAIGTSAFVNCTGLTLVDYYATNCASISSFNSSPIATVNIGENVQVIPSGAFSNCASLNTIIALGTTPPTLGSNAFSNISPVATLFVPCGSQMAYFSNWNMFEYNNIHEDCTSRPVSISSNINGGIVTPSVTQAIMGQEVRLMVVPNQGMTLSSIMVSNAVDPTQTIPVYPVGKTVSTYSFIMPPFGVIVMASFTAVNLLEENSCGIALVYPNPTNGQINVEAEGLKHIAISNMLGQQIFNGSADGDAFEYDFGQHGAGVYLVRIETSEGVATKRVVVTQ